MYSPSVCLRVPLGGVAALCLLAGAPSSAAAEAGATPLDKAARAGVIDRMCVQLEARYVFAEVAADMCKSVNKQQRKGAYEGLTDPAEFTARLTEDLQAISHDKHLRVRYSAEPLEMHEADEPTPEELARLKRRLAVSNFGVEKVEVLDGNVGYLGLIGFVPASLGGETVSAAMGVLAHADSLIIDLRKNGGGSPDMIQLLSSYLFGDDPVHLNSLYWREGDQTQQFWTLPFVQGTRRPDVDVYVLTSSYTFSAAEEFSYNLQALGRATLIGETTGGGAHPGGIVPLDAHFTVWIPQGRAINPITGSNWEGVGVRPDVAVPADKALDTAWVMALEKQLTASDDPRFSQHVQQALDETRARLEAPAP